MKTICMIFFLLPATVGLAADWIDGVLTDCVCQDYVCATQRVSPGQSTPDLLNLPGRGVVNEWKLEKTESGHYILSGYVISNNTGMRKQGVPIYTGDLSRTNLLTLAAISNADGEFRFRLNSYGDAKTQDVDKYLYVGERFIRLMQYEIPYKDVQPATPPYSEPAARPPQR